MKRNYEEIKDILKLSTHTCTYIYTHTHAQTQLNIYIYTRVYKHNWTYIHNTCTNTIKHIYTHTQTQLNIYTHTCTNTIKLKNWYLENNTTEVLFQPENKEHWKKFCSCPHAMSSHKYSMDVFVLNFLFKTWEGPCTQRSENNFIRRSLVESARFFYLCVCGFWGSDSGCQDCTASSSAWWIIPWTLSFYFWLWA